MDPIMLAVRRFKAEITAFWTEAPLGAVLRLVSPVTDLRDMKKALRLFELDPACRRPLLLYEAPFSDERTYFTGLAEQARSDYEAIRKGASEEGVTLPAFEPEAGGPSPQDAGAALVLAARDVEAAAKLLGERLDGLDVALVPSKVGDRSRWERALAGLAGQLKDERVRLAVHDSPDGALSERFQGAANFAIDHAELFRFLKEMGPKPSAGPPVPTPVLSPAKKRELEQKLGHKIPSSDTGRLLRVLLLEGTEALNDGKPQKAARKFREARTVCRLDGLVREEATLLVSVGTAELAAADIQAAHAAYRDAAKLAEGAGDATLCVHAGLGTAGAFLTEKRYADAAAAYERTGEKAHSAGIAPLAIDAWRMAGVCHVLCGAKADGERSFRRALAFGAELGPELRAITTFLQAAEALAAALRAEGRVAHARELEAWAAGLDQPRASASTQDEQAT